MTTKIFRRVSAAGAFLPAAILGLVAISQGQRGENAPTAGEAARPETAPRTRPAEAKVPHYFIAIHNEPAHGIPAGREIIANAYRTLREMVDAADKYDIRLTLMFTAQWADFLSESPERMKVLEGWRQKGHEIAGHHHGIYHGGWDGYTDFTPQEAEAQRIRQGRRPEPYLGTLKDFIARLRKINPEIRSGCMNDEHDKRALPDEIVRDTGAGFANRGQAGQRDHDANPEKARNEYVLAGTWKGIERKWLSHFQITTDERQQAGQKVFDAMSGGVFGAVTHSEPRQAVAYYAFLKFLHERDPQGRHSRTLSEIIEQKLLPEKAISEEALKEQTGPPPGPRRRPGPPRGPVPPGQPARPLPAEPKD